MLLSRGFNKIFIWLTKLQISLSTYFLLRPNQAFNRIEGILLYDAVVDANFEFPDKITDSNVLENTVFMVAGTIDWNYLILRMLPKQSPFQVFDPIWKFFGYIDEVWAEASGMVHRLS